MATGDETSVISFHRLHYGKLGVGDERRVPASAGYAVTRRSRGLDPAWDAHLSPPRLTALHRFEPDAIDIDARADGCFVARPIGGAMVFMRARFRPEDGEGGFGRLHHQSAIWIGDFETWRRDPYVCLTVAESELRAIPDLAQEDERARLNDAPLSWRVARPDSARLRPLIERTAWAQAILELLLDGAETGADAFLDFGAHDFPTEADFLAAVGVALQVLPPAFPRWRDVCVASGLTHPLPGLCLRYVPSWGRARAAA